MDPIAHPKRRDFGLSVIRLGRRWRNVMDAELSKFGLTGATWRPLFYLGELGDGVHPKDLAEALDMERPSLGQLIDRLEQQGFVQRREDPEDHRFKTLHLTDEGRKICSQTEQLSSQVVGWLMAGITDEDIAVCLRVFCQVAENAQDGAKPR
jgi:MarR family transcriptional regulator for hemolysin